MRALAMDIFIPCLPIVAFDFDVSFSLAQWVLSIYFIGAGIGQFVMGPLADLYGRRPVILGSIVLFAVSSIACAMTTSIYALIFTRFLQGLGACGTTVVTMAIIRDLYDDHITPKVYSYLNSIISLAPILAPLLGGTLMLITGSWRSVFYFVTGFSVVAFVVNFKYLKETNPRFRHGLEISAREHLLLPKMKVWRGFNEILTNKDFLIYVFCAITGFTGLFLFFSVSAILLIDKLGIRPDQFGYYFGLNALMYLGANLLSPKLQRVFGVDRVIQAGNVIIVAGALIMLGYNWLFGLTLFGLLFPTGVFTVGVGLLFGPCIASAMRSFRHIAGIASACYGALLYCLSSLLVTLIMQFDIQSSLPLALTMLCMGSVNLLIMRKRAAIAI